MEDYTENYQKLRDRQLSSTELLFVREAQHRRRFLCKTLRLEYINQICNFTEELKKSRGSLQDCLMYHIAISSTPSCPCKHLDFEDGDSILDFLREISPEWSMREILTESE